MTQFHSTNNTQNGNDYLGWRFADGRPVWDPPQIDNTRFAEPGPDPSIAEMARALRIMHRPGDVFELRIFKKFRNNMNPISGYYTDPEQAALATARESEDDSYYAGYVAINPAHEHAIGRGELGSGAETLHDYEVPIRHWLLLDIDVVRGGSGIAANQEEIDAAVDLARQMKDWLAVRGWTDPVEALSANGYHLLYPISLDNTEEHKLLLQSWLQKMDVLAGNIRQGGGPQAGVDKSVFSAGQLTKLYGCFVKKGGNTAERPWRYSRLVRVPTALGNWGDDHRPVITVEQIQASIDEVGRECSVAAGTSSSSESNSTQTNHATNGRANSSGSRNTYFRNLDVQYWLEEVGFEPENVRTQPDGTIVYDLGRNCPATIRPGSEPPHRPRQHESGTAAFFEGPNGEAGFHCFAAGCKERHGWNHWRDVIEKIGVPAPEFWDGEPAELRPRRRSGSSGGRRRRGSSAGGNRRRDGSDGTLTSQGVADRVIAEAAGISDPDDYDWNSPPPMRYWQGAFYVWSDAEGIWKADARDSDTQKIKLAGMLERAVPHFDVDTKMVSNVLMHVKSKTLLSAEKAPVYITSENPQTVEPASILMCQNRAIDWGAALDENGELYFTRSITALLQTIGS